MENENYVNLKLDSVFKSFFTNKNNHELLVDFLSSILDIPVEEITEVEIKSPEIPIDVLDDKFARLDLNLSVAGRNVNVEMQIAPEYAYKERAVYYWAKLYASLKRGESYNSIPETISIHILNHMLFDCEDYQSTFKYYEEKRHELLTNKCVIHFFELPKISESLNKSNKKELWLNLIKAETNERYNEIAKCGGDIMKSAVNVIYDMREDTRLQEEARIREKAINDRYSSLSLAKKEGLDEGLAKGLAEGIEKGLAEGIEKGLAEGIEKGLAEGKQKGRKEALSEIAEKMRKLGLSESAIDEIFTVE